MQRRIFRLCVATLVVAGYFGLAPRASADFINLAFQGGSGNSVNVTLRGQNLPTGMTGPYTWTDTNLMPNPAFNNPIKTFCIELDQAVVPHYTPPTATFKITDPAAAPTLSAAKFESIKALYGNHYDFANDKVIGDKNAAFQLALWEILYDSGNPVDFNSGNFYSAAPSDIEADAAAMLNNSGGGLAKYDTSGYELVALVAPGGVDENGNPAKTQDEVQDQLTIRPKAVPAPAAWILGVIGVGSLLSRRWRRSSPLAA